VPVARVNRNPECASRERDGRAPSSDPPQRKRRMLRPLPLASRAPPPLARRTRRLISVAARRAVSRRMKAYWEQRKAASGEAKAEGVQLSTKPVAPGPPR
jgi:hypothetical protein